MERVAMFPLRFCNKIFNIAKTKIKYKYSTKAQNEIQSEIFSGLGRFCETNSNAVPANTLPRIMFYSV